MSLLFNLNLLLAAGGIALLILTLILFADYCFWHGRLFTRTIKRFLWPLIMLTSIGGVAISLLYSEYFGFIPCSLCWLQRIALYPQALLGIIAFRMKDQVYFPLYGLTLSIFGFAVAIYHYVYQLIPSGTSGGVLPCLADGSADCASKIIDLFGFVTFPFLSAITFAFLIVLYLNLRRHTFDSTTPNHSSSD